MSRTWSNAGAYDRFMGRWSAAVAAQLVPWIASSPGLRWLDVGCGVGAASSVILDSLAPRALVGVDASPDFIDAARRAHGDDDRVERFVVGDAMRLDVGDGFDAVVSNLVLNFLPDPVEALRRQRAALRPDGVVGGSVWHFPRMEMIRRFWDAVVEVEPALTPKHQSTMFGHWTAEHLAGLAAHAGFGRVETREIAITTRFEHFDDYWLPFLGGTGSAPAALATMRDDQRDAVRERLRRTLPTAADASIRLDAVAVAFRATES